MREYGLNRLKNSGEYDERMSRHAQYYLKFKRVSLPWLHRESANLRTALFWAAETEPQTALAVALRMWRLWFVRKEMIATALEKVAQQAFDRKQFARACTLWAAAKAIRPIRGFERLGSIQSPTDQTGAIGDIAGIRSDLSATMVALNFSPANWQDLVAASAELGSEGFENAWNRGAKLDLEHVIDYA